MGEEEKLVNKRSLSNLLILKRFNEEEEENGIELGLGLSMNGRFGVDPRAKRLCRSSSVSDFTNPIKENGFIPHLTSSNGTVSNVNLVRSCSLPVETEEEWLRRKELQTLRRMEAKRKRTEKKKNLRGVKVGSFQNCYNQEQRGEQLVNHGNGILGCGGGGGGGGGVVGGGDMQRVASTPPALVAAQGSQGSGSSGGASDESQPGTLGASKGTEARSPSSVQSFSERKQKSVLQRSTSAEIRTPPSVVTVKDNGASKSTTKNGAREAVRNVLEDMPCVSTKGDGPNGKRIEGFLYRYGQGGEVKIVCVCHGNFLSPAEFVKHAGGGDVEHPLKHIVVNSSQFL